MSLTQVAVILIAVWLILIGASVEVSNTLTLIFGIVAAALVLFDGRTLFTTRAP